VKWKQTWIGEPILNRTINIYCPCKNEFLTDQILTQKLFAQLLKSMTKIPNRDNLPSQGMKPLQTSMLVKRVLIDFSVLRTFLGVVAPNQCDERGVDSPPHRFGVDSSKRAASCWKTFYFIGRSKQSCCAGSLVEPDAMRVACPCSTEAFGSNPFQ
jgi:hypothetical protein